MSKSETLKFDIYDVTVDPERLRFDEQSLNTYIQTEAGYYDNYGAFLALAEKNLQNKEMMFEKVFSERFVEAKEEGSSDKLAEAKAKSDSVVIAIKEKIVDARYVVNRLKNHLKAWDKNHENAQSLGHMLRKQMDKLHGDIYYQPDRGFDQELSKTISPYDTKEASEFESELSLDNMF